MKKEKIEFRVSNLDKAIIEKKAEHSGLSVSEYVRRSALNQKIDCKFTDRELEVYQDLHQFRRNFVLISNMFKIKDPELANKVRGTVELLEKELKKFL